MDWTDEGIVLSARAHGEHAVIAQLLTAAHGRHAGLVRGGASRRRRGVLQPGNRVQAHWRARLPEHLGAFDCEPTDATAAALVLGDATALAALSAACAVAETALPEREPHRRVYDGFLALLAALAGPEPLARLHLYVLWELTLLADLGYGLELDRCAVTGTGDDLAYVSPKSGRAVSRAAAAPYRARLLKLPGFVHGTAPATATDIFEGARLSGHFLESRVYAVMDRRPPVARARFVDRLRQLATISGSAEDT